MQRASQLDGRSDTTFPDTGMIRTHMQRILGSGEFARTPRLAALLRFIVEAAVRGQAEQISESLIAAELYGCPSGFDPKSDVRVAVDLGRVRERLDAYYEATGKREPIRIQLCEGKYVPVFRIVPQPQRFAPSCRLRPVPRWPLRFGLQPAHVMVLALLVSASAGAVMWRGDAAGSSLQRKRAPASEWSGWDNGRPGGYEFSAVRVDGEQREGTRELYNHAHGLHRTGENETIHDQSPDSVATAGASFRELTARRPEFSAGWAGLARALEQEYEHGGNRSPTLLAEARAAAQRAVELDPELADGWKVLTSILLFGERDYEGAKIACRRAMELDPGNTVTRSRYRDILRMQSGTDELPLVVGQAVRRYPGPVPFGFSEP
jgi:hypothetical protein